MGQKIYKRVLNPEVEVMRNSFFLFGPRGVGKSHLLRKIAAKQKSFYINLLDSSLYYQLQRQPSLLREMIDLESPEVIVIDEIQRIPELLNLVHLMIEEKGYRFILTGSSARKLKRGHANMLAGRALSRELFPLTYFEIDDFVLKKYLQFGGLPLAYLSEDPQDFLNSYVNTYLKEEVQAEGLVKKLPAFSDFLSMASVASGEQINFTSISNEVGVSAVTIKEYYSILEDTLLGFFVNPWLKSKKRKPISTAKFFFFDTGVRNTLADIKTLDEKSNVWGQAFEQFIATEIRAYLSYRHKNKIKLCYWRSTSQFEVDFIVGDEVAIEVKSAKQIQQDHVKGLKALQEENIVKNFYLVSSDPLERKVGSISCLNWQTFLKKLWAGEII